MLKLPDANSEETILKSFLKNLFRKFTHWDNSQTETTFRLKIAAFFFLFCYLAISYRLIYITLHSNQHDQNKLLKSINYRREIVDRHGNLLAANLPGSSLFANPQKVHSPEATVEKLSKVITDIDKKKLLADLKSDKTFVWIKRDLSPRQQNELNNLGLPGFYFENELKRVYTHSNLLSHILGYVDRDNNGLAGVEKYFNKELNSTTLEEPPLELSIDYRVQNIVSEELDNTISKFRAQGGVGIVADVTTGEILAMVSKPDFDPHNPAKSTPKQLFNNASLGAFEIGSGFKTITFAVGFDTKTIMMNDAYHLGNFTISKFKVKDYHKHDGWNTVPQLFMNSSNIGSSMIALEIGRKTFKEYLQKFGLLKQLNIELPEKAAPLFPADNKWSDLGLVTMSYGYGISISPLHYVQAMIPIVNGGYFHPVTLLKKESTSLTSEQILSPETSLNINRLMRLTVEKGTGRKAEVKGYLPGGKTGTANKLGTKGYLNNSRFSSFVEVAPAINPKFIIFIFLDDPQGTKETFGFATAGFTAAPAAGNILNRLVTLYGLQPYDEEDENIKNILHVDYTIENEI